MSREYEVLRISTYGEEETDPVIQANNVKYPEIVQYVKDEAATFVINVKTRRFWRDSDFFEANPNIMGFKVTA